MIPEQMPLHYVHLGEVRGEEGGRCLDTMSRKAGQKVGRNIFSCCIFGF
jgi:hypothetical protein